MQHPTFTWIHYAQFADGSIALVCQTCGAQHRGSAPTADAFLATHSQHASHYGAGDVIAGITNRLGIKPCTPCEARKQALNKMLPRVWRR